MYETDLRILAEQLGLPASTLVEAQSQLLEEGFTMERINTLIPALCNDAKAQGGAQMFDKLLKGQIALFRVNHR